MKRIITVLCLAVCLLTAGCAKEPVFDNTPTDSGVGTQPPAVDTDIKEPQPFNWDLELDALRQTMSTDGKTVAVAYLGFCGARADASEHINDNCKRFNEDYGFLSSIPNERIIGDGGQLFCIVAVKNTAAISVNRLNDNGEVAKAEWTGDGSIPLLIFANNGGFEPDMQVGVYTDSDEAVLNLHTDVLSRTVTYDLASDFSNYHDIANQSYSMAGEGAWDKPTKEALVNTSWSASRYINEYVTEEYSLDFFENTVKIVWNEGIGEFTANWSLSEKDGVTILTIDLENLDGLRSYAVLLSPDMLKLFSDFTSDGDIRDYESLSTLFTKTVG